MDKTNIKIVALVLVILFIFISGFAVGSSQQINVEIDGDFAVNNNSTQPMAQTAVPTTASPAITTTVSTATESTEPSQATTLQPTQSTTAALQTASGLTSNDINEVLTYYKKIAEVNPTLTGQNQMSIGEITGEGATTSAIKMVKPMIDKMVAEPYEHTTFPGTASLLTAEDIVSASAVSDGTYTTISLVIKDQPGAEAMQAEEGSVGHAMGIIGDISSKVTDVIKFKDGGYMTLSYSDCKITVKAENDTYKLIEGRWENTGLIEINEASVLGILSVKKANCPLITVITTL